MDIITYLRNLITAKEQRAAELRKLIKEASTADECRDLGETLQTVLDELNDAKAQLENQENDEGGDEGDQQASNNNGGEERGANPMHEFRGAGRVVGRSAQRQDDQDPTNSVQYRTAFMNFVCRNVPIPMELRTDATTKTTDASAVIPTTLLHEIIREVKTYGEIYAKVRHLNVQGGVEIPILSLLPKATWITANTGTSESEKQKLQANTKISFNYYGLECKLAQTLLTNVTTLEIFQEEFVKLAAEAMVQAIEVAIFNGTGSGMPLGITKDSRVPTANVITLTEAEFSDWEAWHKKVFAKMKKSYRDGEFFMAQGTFDGYIDGMVDKNGQPVGRTNYGISDASPYRFGGKTVQTVEDDIVADFAAATSGTVVAVFAKLSNYGLNNNMDVKVVKWEDHDTNELKNKTIMVCDGKLIDPYGVLIIKKGAASA
jgi:HK97 family phage major capsid protein